MHKRCRYHLIRNQHIIGHCCASADGNINFASLLNDNATGIFVGFTRNQSCGYNAETTNFSNNNLLIRIMEEQLYLSPAEIAILFYLLQYTQPVSICSYAQPSAMETTLSPFCRSFRQFRCAQASRLQSALALSRVGSECVSKQALCMANPRSRYNYGSTQPLARRNTD